MIIYANFYGKNVNSYSDPYCLLFHVNEDNKYNKGSGMHKGSLVEILFESTESAAKAKKLSMPECGDKEIICRQY